MNEMTATPREKLMADLKVVIADAEELLRLTADEAGDKAAELRGRMQLRAQQARAELARLQGLALDRATEAGKAADDYVHDHPWKAIGLAAGAGLLVGLLIGRR